MAKNLTTNDLMLHKITFGAHCIHLCLVFTKTVAGTS